MTRRPSYFILKAFSSRLLFLMTWALTETAMCKIYS